MRIQHNIAALNSYRNLTTNNSAVSKNLEKLSSGYKINRAGDDAAGLAISEKMRAQITGLETAQKNANDGISLVQTAEGALTEVHSMLNRMVELANQSANGTYDDTDRAQLQKEIQSLNDEIDRISEGTNFNGIKLLDGSMGGGSIGASGTFTNAAGDKFEVTLTAPEGVSITFADGSGEDKADSKASMTGKNITVTLGSKDDAATYSAADINKLLADAGIDAKISLDKDISLAKGDSGAMTAITASKPTNAKFTGGTTAKYEFEATSAGAINFKVEVAVGVGGPIGATKAANGDIKLYLDSGEKYTADELNKILKDSGITEIKATKDLAGNADNMASAAATTAGTGVGGSGLQLQIGDTADSFNQLTVRVGNMSASSLGIGGIDISTQTGAKDAVQKIKDAINTVSSTRGDLGAIQNRLEHTINNLSVTTENMTAAESRIRDVDMANEMMAYTKNNILVQSSQAMLAQANQIPQGVLQLLQ